jgi:hypothetical protein
VDAEAVAGAVVGLDQQVAGDRGVELVFGVIAPNVSLVGVTPNDATVFTVALTVVANVWGGKAPTSATAGAAHATAGARPPIAKTARRAEGRSFICEVLHM